MSVPVAARLVEAILLVGRDADPSVVLKLIPGEPSLTTEMVRKLAGARVRCLLLLEAVDVVAHREALALAWACHPRGTLDDASRAVLLGAHRREGGLLLAIGEDEENHDDGLDPVFLPLPRAAASADARGLWEDDAGVVVDLREALERGETVHTQTMFVFGSPTKDGTRFGVWSGGTMALGEHQTQSEAYAVLGLDDDPVEAQRWLDEVVPNTGNEAARFSSFFNPVWMADPWWGRKPNEKSQGDLLCAAAWLMLGRADVLERALELSPTPPAALPEPPGAPEQRGEWSLSRAAGFLVAAIRVAALCPGDLERRRDVASALLHIGHADARRVSSFLRQAHPDVATKLGDRDRSLTRHRVDAWKKDRDRAEQLRAALRIACDVGAAVGK